MNDTFYLKLLGHKWMDTTKFVMPSKEKRSKKRQRADSASDRAGSSVTRDAPDVAGGEDPRTRLAAFHARMFDVGTVNSSSAAASSMTLRVAEEDAAPLLATIKRNVHAGRASKRHKAAMAADDDEVMPRVTVKAVKTQKVTKRTSAPDALEPAVTKISTPATKSVARAPGVGSAASTVTPSASVTGKAAVASESSHNHKKKKMMKSDTVESATVATTDERLKKKVKKVKKKVEEEDSSLAAADGALESSSGLTSSLVASPAPAAGARVAVTASKASVPNVVTQEQLAMFSDVVSLEADDPLESAMKAVKEQMKASAKSKKIATPRKAAKKASEKRVVPPDEDGGAASSRKQTRAEDGDSSEVQVESPASHAPTARARVSERAAEKTAAQQRGAVTAAAKKKMLKRTKVSKRARGLSVDSEASAHLAVTSPVAEESAASSVASAVAEHADANEQSFSGKKLHKAAVVANGDDHEVMPTTTAEDSTTVNTKKVKQGTSKEASVVDALDSSAAKLSVPAKRSVVRASGVESAGKQPKVESGDKVKGAQELDESGEESGEEFDSAILSQERIFSNLIDEAARQQWELLEVGRLVKLFAGQWGQKKKKTARFLCAFCPELVNVDFLEGLGINLRPKQLVKIFERGSGSAVVLMNKLASVLENGNLSVRDPAFIKCISKRVQRMATNAEVLEFLVPLLESLSTVRDVSQLLKQVCHEWHLERSASLVQQILLTAVFDDLDGNQDEILKDLPELAGKLDFPSRLDQEDADENGNLIGLIANDGSDLGEESGASEDEAEDALSEIASEDEEMRASDEDEDDEPYEGETDSEEERAIRAQHRPKRRSRFILDEADEESDGHESADPETEGDDNSEAEENKDDLVSEESSGESESDSDDESWRSKPKAMTPAAKH